MMLGRPNRFAAGLAILLLASALALAACRYLSILAGMENIAADIRIAALQPAAPQSEDVVVLAIDETTLAQFPYRSPVDRQFLADLLTTLDQKGAKAIGLDVILDQPTEEAKDLALADTIRSLNTPLFVSYTSSPAIVNEEQREFLDAFVPADLRAEANMLTDPFDGSVRWINPGGDTAERPRGFVFKALERAGQPVPPAAAEIAWHSMPDADTPAFPSFPAMAAPVLPDEWFKDKIVLIGAVLSLTDRHRTPLAVIDDGDRGMMPGVLIQAHGIAQYLEGRQAPRLSLGWSIALAILAATCGLLISLSKRGLLFHLAIGMWCVAGYWALAFIGYAYGLPLLPVILPSLSFLFSLWMMDLLIGRAERKQREYVQGAFSRYVSPAVVDQLVNDPSAMAISGTRRDATFIFTDIAGFTTLSEQLSSEALADTLNAYLDGACAIILRHEGTIDKFIGDAIMAIFNAPIAQPDHAARAVRCAVELDAYAESFRKERNAAGIPIGVTRIGVHSGAATIGNFGSSSRMDFTALGDTVNIAARTEGVNKYFGTRICCTDEVVRQCPDMTFLPIGDVVLKGKQQAVTLWSPLDGAQDAAFASGYAAAFALLRANDPSAAESLSALDTAYPGQPLVAYHLNRIASGHLSARVTMDEK